MHPARPLAVTALVFALAQAAFAAQPGTTPGQTSSPSANSSAAQAGHAFDHEAVAIFAMLNRQAADWNRGDLDAFATGYKNSPDILFIGRTVSHGYDGMLASYKAHYPNREAMGTLTFTQLAAQGLDAHFATATGHFHLERTTAGGGNVDGYFLLVLEKTAQGWKIVRDDSTTLPAQ